MRDDRRDRARGERCERCCAVFERQLRQPDRGEREIVAVERLRRARRKEWIRENALDERLVNLSPRCEHAAFIERWAAMRMQEIVDQGVAGTGVAGKRSLAGGKIGNIGDAADIDDDERPRPVDRRGQRLMVDRDKGRALPAGGDVRRAKVEGDRNCEASSKGAAVPDLHRQFLGWPMQHRLAMKTDDVDVARRKSMAREKRRDHFGMRIRHEPLGVRENARTRIAVGQRHRRRQRFAQQGALRLRIRPVAGRAQTIEPLAVGVDERDVDAVERGAAHQPDRATDRHFLPPIGNWLRN